MSFLSPLIIAALPLINTGQGLFHCLPLPFSAVLYRSLPFSKYGMIKSSSYKHLYKTKAWQSLRAGQLWTNPLCAFCQAIATVADHITPHKGCPILFHDETNLQSLCKGCHDSTKKQIELRGYHSLVDEYGRPTDPNHPVNRKPKI